MSLDVTFTRDSHGCPRLPQVTGAWIQSDANSQRTHQLTVAISATCSYGDDGKLVSYVEKRSHGERARFWFKHEGWPFVNCRWFFDGKQIDWGSGFVEECTMRNGQWHGFVREWGPPRDVSVGPPKLRLMIRGRRHSGCWWMGAPAFRHEYQRHLPRAEQLAKVLPLSVARRLISFL